MIENYKTVAGSAEAEIVEKKSRFIANVSPVDSEEDALAFLDSMKKKYRDARHNCHAFQVGTLQRLSDDGEPSGTAGKPILDILAGEQIQNTIVVVTRYFGGTLLGTGGLVRAYGKSAKEGLLKAGIVEKILYSSIRFEMEYSDLGKIQYEANQLGHIVNNVEYTDKVCATILAQFNTTESFIKKISDLTNGNVIGIATENLYLDSSIK